MATDTAPTRRPAAGQHPACACGDQAVLSVRVPAALAETLKARAAEEHVPTSALIRRILVRAVREGTKPVLTVEQVEEIARRVMRESA